MITFHNYSINILECSKTVHLNSRKNTSQIQTIPIKRLPVKQYHSLKLLLQEKLLIVA